MVDQAYCVWFCLTHAAMLVYRAINGVLCAPPTHHGLLQPLQQLRTCIHQAVETRQALLQLSAVHAAI